MAEKKCLKCETPISGGVWCPPCTEEVYSREVEWARKNLPRPENQR